MPEKLQPVQWTDDHKLILLDQTQLPNAIVYETIDTIEPLWWAIKKLKVRGAPLIGVSAAYGAAISARLHKDLEKDEFFAAFHKDLDYLATSRPTAVNLFWAIDRMKKVAEKVSHLPVEDIAAIIEAEAKIIHRRDGASNRKIGEYGLTLLKDGMGVMTHCNAGLLAGSDVGTATAPFYTAQEKGVKLKIYSNETRPLLQGSRLTVFELQQAGMDVTLLCDNMAATVMGQGKIDAVIVGADRIAANGDTANKIGTCGVAILAKYFGIPFYIAAPLSTVDMSLKDGSLIPIEERDGDEIRKGFGPYTAPKDIPVYNPAFDVTPNSLITAIITDKGILYPPYSESLKKAKEDAAWTGNTNAN